MFCCEPVCDGFLSRCSVSVEHADDVQVSTTMTLEEAEEMTSSTLSDSTQMSMSNISSQPMSLSVHSEVSAVSHLSETEKHEMEDTIESGTEEYAQGFEEIEHSATMFSDDEDMPVTIDEKCVSEMRDSEKHVRFPQEDATTDVMYTNEQMSQSVEAMMSAASVSSPNDETTSLTFAHCTVDELSRGRPKEKMSEEVKEVSSMTSSIVTEESTLPSTEMTLSSPTDTPASPELLSESPTETLTPMAEEQSTFEQHAHHESSRMSEKKLVKRVSFDNGLPSTFPVFSFGDLPHEHKPLSATSSLDVCVHSDAQSLHSDDVELTSSSHSGGSTSQQEFLAGMPLSEDFKQEKEELFETEVSQSDLADIKTDLVVEGLDYGYLVSQSSLSVVSKGTSLLTNSPNYFSFTPFLSNS